MDIPQFMFLTVSAGGAGAGHLVAVVKLHIITGGAVGGHGIVDLGPCLGQTVSCGNSPAPASLGRANNTLAVTGPVDACMVVKIKAGAAYLSANPV